MQEDVAGLELGPIGNCNVSALVDRRARVVWCCLPRPDSTPVFDALLQSRHGVPAEGAFGIELEGAVRSEQAYDAGTAILRTRLLDATGSGIEVTDFAPRFITRDRVFRPAQIVRRVRPLPNGSGSGSGPGAGPGARDRPRHLPRIRIRVHPQGEWGAAQPEVVRGSHHLRFLLPSLTLRLNTSAPLTYVAEGTWFTLHEGVSLLLGPDETFAGSIEETARDFEEQTALYWRRWTRRLALPLQWQDAVMRAAITLKLCQYEDTGAILAALTTSLPEAPGSGRNWDYRYCWLRDAFFVVRALNGLAEVGTMEGYLRWLYDVVRGAQADPASGGVHVQPLYGIGLEAALPERTVQRAAGYRGMGPVRVGNQAHQHFQHDVYGNVVLGAAQAFHDRRLLRPADAGDFAALEAMGERAFRLHDQPDAGMWELRSRSRVHTSSSLMCWAACDRLAHVARALGLAGREAFWHEREAFWRTRAATIRRAIETRAWNPERGAFVESFEGRTLDASVLLMAEVGFLPPRDPRFVSTVNALDAALAHGPFMRRYEAADDFGLPETTFNVCSFWRIDALARIGRRGEAVEAFEALLARRTALGLLSEDLDPKTGELWGNFPQTYSMVGIINGAVRLSAPWDSVV
jgi:GH15 family glucan-1,4-alpha-glucosidase